MTLLTGNDELDLPALSHQPKDIYLFLHSITFLGDIQRDVFQNDVKRYQ